MVDSVRVGDHSGSRLRHGVGLGFAGFLAVLGVWFTMTALGFGLTAPGNPIGPGAMPAALGVLLVVGAVVIAVSDARALLRLSRSSQSSFVTSPGAEGEAQRDAEGADANEGRHLLRAILVLACLGGGLALTPLIGMVLGLTLAVVAICAFVEHLSLWRVALVGATTGVLLWLVFGVLLSVNFPDSLIGL